VNDNNHISPEIIPSLRFISLHFTPLHSLFFISQHFWNFRHHTSKTLHFSTLIISFLKICDWQWKVRSASAVSWFRSLIVLNTQEYLFFVSWSKFMIVIIRAPIACSFKPVLYTFPCPFSGVCFEKCANASYLPALRQVFPDKSVRMICRFSRFLLHAVWRIYLTVSLWVPARSPVFKNRTH